MTVICDIKNTNYETALNTIIRNASSVGLTHKVTKGDYGSTIIELTDEKLPQPIVVDLHETGSCLRASYKEKPKLSLGNRFKNLLRDSFVKDIEGPHAYLRVEDEKFRYYMKKVLTGLRRSHMRTVLGGGD